MDIENDLHSGFALVLAWPETKCKQAGAWYDYPLQLMNLNKNGYLMGGRVEYYLAMVSPKPWYASSASSGWHHGSHGPQGPRAHGPLLGRMPRMIPTRTGTSCVHVGIP